MEVTWHPHSGYRITDKQTGQVWGNLSVAQCAKLLDAPHEVCIGAMRAARAAGQKAYERALAKPQAVPCE